MISPQRDQLHIVPRSASRDASGAADHGAYRRLAVAILRLDVATLASELQTARGSVLARTAWTGPDLLPTGEA